MVKNLPAMQETWVWSLGQEDPLEKGMAPTPVFLPGEFHEQKSLAGYSPWDRRVRHDWATSSPLLLLLLLSHFSHVRLCLLPRANKKSSSFPHTYTFPLFRNALMLDRLKGCPHACLSPPDLSSWTQGSICHSSAKENEKQRIKYSHDSLPPSYRVTNIY